MNDRKQISPGVLGTASLLCVVGAAGAAAEGRHDVIARSGDPAPDTPAGALYSSFGNPVLNAGGQVAFQGFLQTGGGGVTSSNDSGLWRDSTLVAREGFQAQGAPSGALYSSFGSPVLNAGGQLAFRAFLQIGSGGVTGSNNTGLWRDSTLVAREGFQALGAPSGALYSSFGNPVLNAGGQVAFQAFLQTGGGGVTSSNDSGLWRDSTLVAREGFQAQGAPAGALYSSFFDPVLNAGGQLAFEATLQIGSGGVTSSNDRGLWRDSTLVAREGFQAQGAPAGALYSSFFDPVLNAGGQVAFQAFLQTGGGGVTGSNDSGLWRDSTLVAREGFQAQGAPAGALYSSFGNPVLNAGGQVAFEAFLQTGGGGVTGSNNSGLWRDSTLVAREGFQAQGAPAGALYSSFVSPVLNAGGQLAFQAFLQIGSGGVTGSNDSGLWLNGPNGDTVLVAREGEAVDGLTFSSFQLRTGSGGEEGRGASLNDFSQLVYEARLFNADEAVVLFTPDLHWRSNLSSTWDNRFNWTIAQAPGAPHAVLIDPSSSVSVTGPAGDVTVQSLEIGGGAGIGTLALGFGTLTATDGTTVQSTGVLTGDGVIAGGVTNLGTVRADNVTIAGGLTNQGLITGAGRITAALINQAGGVIHAGAGQALVLSGSGHDNSGQINVTGGDIEIDGGFNHRASAELTVIDGGARFSGAASHSAGSRVFADNALLRFDGGLTLAGQLNVTFGGATLFGDIQVQALGQILLSSNSQTTFFDAVTNGGEIRVSTGSVATFFGDVSGPGSYTGTGTKFYEALFSPGASPGLVTDEGNAAFGAGATLALEIGGRAEGSEHDHYEVAGELAAAGTLKVSLLENFTPEAGDSFDLIDWGTLLGAFDAVDLSEAALTEGLHWELGELYATGSLSVTAVPLPGGVWLLAGGLGALLRAGRRGCACSAALRR